jgi:tetratricopeptide (TPR) repeat protein
MNSSVALPPNSRLQGLPAHAINAVVAAAQALEHGDVASADRQVTGLRALFPQHPEVLRLAAGVHSLRGEHEHAIAALRVALAARPDDALYHNTLGATLIEIGDYDNAIATLQRACELDPQLAVAWFNLGLAAMRSMRVDEAAAALQRAVALSPQQFTAQVILADMLRAQGRGAEAIAEYRRVLAREPRAGMAWWGLADIKTLRLADADIDGMRRILARADVAEFDRIPLGFALAKALDDQARHAEALACLREAHARAQRLRPWSAQKHSAALDAVLAAFAANPASNESDLGEGIVFVTSLPRSGSTLIEQILASHSQVEGAGELPDLPMVLTEESRRCSQAFPQWIGVMTAADWTRLGRRYLERTRHWRVRRPRSVDKLPYNWFYIGAIRAMLPRAHVVIVRRNPLETCLSCYRQYLAGNDYTHNFDDLAAFWRDFDRAGRHWRAQHPQYVHESRYEELIATPQESIQRLLQFLELPFEAACLEFHKTTRDVHTPSAAQVREPLRRDTARAARYGAWLDPLRAALGLPAFDPGGQQHG